MMVLRKLLVLFVILGIAAGVSACGRKNAPEQPPDSSYPRQYPTQ